MPGAAVRFENVSKAFGPKRVLEDFSFDARPGEILFILGKSGAGKSVTLKHLVGLVRPDRGRVFVGQDEVSRLDEEALGPVRRRCGMVFQHPALLDSLTVRENVGFGLRSPLWDPLRAEERLREVLALVKLGPEILARKPPELSYGMQKRVSLARTLAPGPEILLFDEPTTGLDPITTRAVNRLILDLSRELKVTSLVVSHDMESALEVADRILVLDEGRILALGTPAEIECSDAQLIRDFLEETLARRKGGSR
jgi:phospholipid/cholesterol/gamma-HCH transport system ATP-binding protein